MVSGGQGSDWAETPDSPTSEEITPSVFNLCDEFRPPKSEKIERFLKEYESERDQKEWKDLKDQAIKICEEQLEKKNLRAYVTGRVKERESLRKRLYEYPPNKDEGILSQRWDFVGLRIVVFFPGQIREVEKIIQEAFEEQPKHRKPKGAWSAAEEESSIQPSQPYLKRFGGYDEAHYWVKLRMEDRTSVGVHNEQMFEIQLRTVMMDSWITVVHDLEYKAMAGDLSIEEHRILDSIKGLASTGEVLLEHLEQIHFNRRASDEKVIEDAAGLERLLREYLPEIQIDPSIQEDGCNVFFPLFAVLKASGVTTTGALRITLRKLDIRRMLKYQCQDWVQSVQLFQATPLDFILYTILRRIPDRDIGLIWQKIVLLKLRDLSTEKDSSRDRSIWGPRIYTHGPERSDKALINEFISPLVRETLLVVIDQMLSRQGHREARRIFKESDIERFAALWYGSMVWGIPTNYSYVLDLLTVIQDRNISSLEFAFQRHLLLRIYKEICGETHLIHTTFFAPKFAVWLNNSVKNHGGAWDIGFDEFSRMVSKYWAGTYTELATGRAWWSSLRAAVYNSIPSLLHLEIKRYKYIHAQKISADDWSLLLRSLVGRLSAIEPNEERFRRDVRELLAIITKHIKLKDRMSLQLLVRNMFTLNQNDVRVLVEGRGKWPFDDDLDEIIAKYKAG
ncbi:hypothetical protein F5Y13DRAFT_82028 [Hypoxylon sp. FL1857]|nr:hypothetical protein F5Y13DRAFT_82028 [Hypoxylon sp. FL1857]